MADPRRIVLVVAAAENGVIGRDGSMPWRLPDDLKHFKAITLGHALVMGRRTWDELGGVPLPGRQNIVLTKNVSFEANGADVVHSPTDALAIAAGHDDIMIIGGGAVYRLFMDEAQVIELTRIHASIDGDTTFPELDDGWSCLSSTDHPADDRHAHAFTFERWIRGEA